MQNYETLEILIGQKYDQGYPITVIQSPNGDANAISPLDPDDPELQEALAALAMGDTDHDFLIELGHYLFNAIFHEDVLTCYRQSLSALNAQDKALRLLLRLEPPELATVPWEYLYDPKEQMFLAIDQETALVRYLPVGISPRPTESMLPLRILIVISNPVDLVQLNVDQEKQLIEEALADRIRAGQIELRFVEAATVRNINEAIREFQPHVFHFVGHSAFRDGVTSVVLEDEQNRATLIADHTFKTFFNGSKETRLAVMNSCQSATLSDHQRFAGLVPHLFHNKLSAVVAMQYPITDQASLVFVREFYRTLAQVGSVEVAVSEARGGIYRETDGQSSEWGTPVLYLRARKGQLIRWITEQHETPSDIPPPPEPDRPPQASNFVGRKKELAHYHRRLEEDGITLIVGMAGVGKSTLAAKLAREIAPKDQIFWYRFDPEGDMLTFVWQIAGFLAGNGQKMLWHKLYNCLQNNHSLPPLDTVIDHLTTQLRQGRYLICLDDFHFVDGNPDMKDFIQNLQIDLVEGKLKMMIMSRQIISTIRVAIPRTLEGLTEAETTQFLIQHNLLLSTEQIKALYERTEGNAELLVLAANVLQQEPDPQWIIRQLAQEVDIEQYLLNEVHDILNENERGIMSSIAVLLGQENADAIETVSDDNNVRRNLAYLIKRYLLSVTRGEIDREYIQHTILQDFYYKLLNNRARLAMHRRAGAYYLDEKQDHYKALLHYHKAGDYDEAIALLDGNIWPLTYQGHLHSLRTMITEIPKTKLTPEQQAIVLLAQAQLDGYLGEIKVAEHCYGQADSILAQEPTTFQVQKRRAQIARGMAFLLRSNTPQKALDWVKRGLALIDGKSAVLEADLLTMQGTIQRRLGEKEDALASLKKALALQNTIPTRQRLLTLLALGNSYYYLGDLEKMYKHLTQAEEIGEAIHDYESLLSVRSSLAAYHQTLGQAAEALQTYEKALQNAEELGLTRQILLLRLSYGVYLIQHSQFGLAQEQITLALEDAQSIQFNEVIVSCYCRLTLIALASLELSHLDPKQLVIHQAEDTLNKAKQLAQKKQITYQMPHIHWLQARLYLARNRLAEADIEARKALEIAQELNMPLEEGQAWRVLGQILVAQDEVEEAVALFEKSLVCLQDNSYEKALTEQMLIQSRNVNN